MPPQSCIATAHPCGKRRQERGSAGESTRRHTTRQVHLRHSEINDVAGRLPAQPSLYQPTTVRHLPATINPFG